MHTSAYAGSYDLNNLSANYLGDPGTSDIAMTYSVVLPALTNLVVVVNETDPNACTGTYTVTVRGVNTACPAFTATITPTPTRTPTPICPSAWIYRTPYPIGILDQAIASQGGKLYSFGGISNGSFVTNTYAYNPSTNAWTALAPLPAQCFGYGEAGPIGGAPPCPKLRLRGAKSEMFTRQSPVKSVWMS